MSNEKDIKDGAVETATGKMTTEMFHAQLVKNTEAINKEREEYEHKRAELQQDLDDQKTFCSVSNRKLQTEKLEYKIQVNRQQEMFEKTECNIRETLSQANKEFNEKYAKLKSEHALKNLELQNERHKIFEAYRNSGGANLAEDSQQMYPEGWSRPRPKDAAANVAANVEEERMHPIFEECEVMNAGKPAREHMLSMNGMYISGITDEQLKEMHEKLGKMLSGK